MGIVAVMASIKNMIIKTKKAGTTYIINVWFLLMSGCCCLSVVVFSRFSSDRPCLWLLSA